MHTGQADGNPDVQPGRRQRFISSYEPVFVWLNGFHTAISDAVRTSLGPRGMDKMVFYHSDFILIPDVYAGLTPRFKQQKEKSLSRTMAPRFLKVYKHSIPRPRW